MNNLPPHEAALLAAYRKLSIAAELVLEQRHGNGLTDVERRFVRDGFLEQVERRYREEVEGDA